MSDFYINTDLHPTIDLISELQYISKITQKKINAKKDNESLLFEKTFRDIVTKVPINDRPTITWSYVFEKKLRHLLGFSKLKEKNSMYYISLDEIRFRMKMTKIKTYNLKSNPLFTRGYNTKHISNDLNLIFNQTNKEKEDIREKIKMEKEALSPKIVQEEKPNKQPIKKKISFMNGLKKINRLSAIYEGHNNIKSPITPSRTSKRISVIQPTVKYSFKRTRTGSTNDVLYSKRSSKSLLKMKTTVRSSLPSSKSFDYKEFDAYLKIPDIEDNKNKQQFISHHLISGGNAKKINSIYLTELDKLNSYIDNHFFYLNNSQNQKMFDNLKEFYHFISFFMFINDDESIAKEQIHYTPNVIEMKDTANRILNKFINPNLSTNKDLYNNIKTYITENNPKK